MNTLVTNCPRCNAEFTQIQPSSPTVAEISNMSLIETGESIARQIDKYYSLRREREAWCANHFLLCSSNSEN